MRNLSIIFLMVVLFNYGQVNAQSKQKAKLVQMCLDDMYNSKMFRFLEKSPVNLIRNEYSSGLENLHFGKIKVVLKYVVMAKGSSHPLHIKDAGANFLIVFYQIVENDKVKVGIYIPNETLENTLIRKNNIWVITNRTATGDEPSITAPATDEN